jgi:hypothetical protein
MEDPNYRGIIITCALGLIIIFAFLAFFKPQESFTELYFEDHTALPKEFRVGEAQTVAFTVISHESMPLNYTYEVKIQNESYKTGFFLLNPGVNKTVPLNLSFNRPYLTRIRHNGTIINEDPFPRRYLISLPGNTTVTLGPEKTLRIGADSAYIYDLVKVQVNLYYRDKTSEIHFFTVAE